MELIHLQDLLSSSLLHEINFLSLVSCLGIRGAMWALGLEQPELMPAALGTGPSPLQTWGKQAGVFRSPVPPAAHEVLLQGHLPISWRGSSHLPWHSVWAWLNLRALDVACGHTDARQEKNRRQA